MTNVRDWIPMRWPQSWGPPHYRAIPKAAINCIVVDHPDQKMAAAYAADGVAVTSLAQSGAALVPSCKWPQVQTGAGSGGADAGPTGVPWVDANGYVIQLTRALQPDQPTWLDYGPPSGKVVESHDHYRLAICDAEAYGGRWVLRAPAEDFSSLTKTLGFFAQHRNWREYRPIAKLAIVSDFAGPNRALAVEVLNLLPRRLVPYVILPEARLAAANLNGFAALLRMGKQPPAPGVAAKLAQFRKGGGIVIQPQSADPFQVAVETHLSMTRKHDLLRLWNDGSMNVHYTASPDGKEHLVQLLNYSATKSSDLVTLGLTHPYRSATLYTLDDAPRPIALHAARSGSELQLPPFPVYAAISLSL